eukprot:CAMPEP_0116561994 /NCGR_PEP_ID=MMETSP0397-20121206/11904_1 /TAXON_ID=216820 /ORGANISM="Cyclophora tenuis, Strain ECT3854" /LENGTH=187 /DNA_ID=CAMNT_0004088223 /DNA_START=426 /DNA_END=989 /DNA_ORIENTATION=+
MSTISGFSGVSGLSTTDTHMMGSALSLGSSGFGPASLRAAKGERSRQKGGQVSDLTHSFMSMSGLSRSPSFGDLSSQGDVPMSDASIKALMSEGGGIGDFTTHSFTDATYSLHSGASMRSHLRSNPMSVTSGGSVVSSAKSVGSGNSWLHPIAASEDIPWQDDRSFMSDVSGNLVALDLASASARTD